MRERKHEVVLIDFGRACARCTRYVCTFSSLDEAWARAGELNKELDRTRFPMVEWVVRQNPFFEEAK